MWCNNITTQLLSIASIVIVVLLHNGPLLLAFISSSQNKGYMGRNTVNLKLANFQAKTRKSYTKLVNLVYVCQTWHRGEVESS